MAEVDPPFITSRWVAGSTARHILSESFLNPEFKSVIKGEILRIRTVLLNLGDASMTDEDVGKVYRRFQQQLLVWQQLQLCVTIFENELKED